LVTELGIFAILASKHVGPLLNKVFTYLKDITQSPGYLKGCMGNFQNDCCRPYTKKIFQELVFKAFSAAFALIATRSDRFTEIYFYSN